VKLSIDRCLEHKLLNGFQQQGHEIPRIRGGGGEKKASLLDVAQSLWEGTIIHACCKMNAKGTLVKDNIIGYVDGIEQSSCDKIICFVVVFSMGTKGLIEEIPMKVNAKKLFVVKCLTDEGKIAEYWSNKKKWKLRKVPINPSVGSSPLEHDEILQVVKSINSGISGTLDKERTVRDLFLKLGSLKSLGEVLLRIYLNSTDSDMKLKHFGQFQDNQMILWLSNDPQALFLVDVNISFDQLQKFPEWPLWPNQQDIQRLTHGHTIQKVVQSLLTKVCIENSLDDGMEAIVLQNLEEFALKDPKGNSIDFFNTLLCILSLFDENGFFRFSINDIKQMLLSTMDFSKCNQLHLNPIKLIDHRRMTGPKLQCCICDLGTENIIPRYSTKDRSTFVGVGCSLLSSAAKSNYSITSANSGMENIKRIMLSLVENIPLDLYTSDKSVSSYETNICNSQMKNTWKDFVLVSCNVAMLGQAVIQLILSLDCTKLPYWWQDKNTGWTQASVVGGVSSFAELHHHMIVLDLAILEFKYNHKIQM
jgi:hypothetical protein